MERGARSADHLVLVVRQAHEPVQAVDAHVDLGRRVAVVREAQLVDREHVAADLEATGDVLEPRVRIRMVDAVARAELELERFGRERRVEREARAGGGARHVDHQMRVGDGACLDPRGHSPPGLELHAEERQRIQPVPASGLEVREPNVERDPARAAAVQREGARSDHVVERERPQAEREHAALPVDVERERRAGGRDRALERGHGERELVELEVELARDGRVRVQVRQIEAARGRAARLRCGERQQREVEPDHGAARLGATSIRGEAQRELAQRARPARDPRARLALDAQTEADALGLEAEPAHQPRFAGLGAVGDLAVGDGECQPRQACQIDALFGRAKAQHRALEHPVERQELPREQARPGLVADRVLDLEQRGLVGCRSVRDAQLFDLDPEARARPERDRADLHVPPQHARERARHELGVGGEEQRRQGSGRNEAEHPRGHREPPPDPPRAAGLGLGIGLRQCLSPQSEIAVQLRITCRHAARAGSRKTFANPRRAVASRARTAFESDARKRWPPLKNRIREPDRMR